MADAERLEKLLKTAPPRPEELLVIDVPLKEPQQARAKRLYEARRDARKTVVEDEVDAILHDILAGVEKEVAAARPGQPIHRMYLLRRAKPEERPAAEGEAKVVASRALSEREGFTSTVSDVHAQLKAEATEPLAERVSVKKPPKPAVPAAPAAPVVEVTLEDLLKPAAPPAAEFAKVQAEAARCPHCKASGLRIVFCPFCGKGLCANCSPRITPRPEAITYVCPSCGEEIHVKKGLHEK